MRPTTYLRAALIVAYLGFVLTQLDSPTGQAALPYAMGGFYGLMALVRAADVLWARWRWRQEIHAFRRYGAPTQAQILDGLWSSGLRSELRRRLDGHEGHESDGVVERFAFADADRQETARLFWTLAPVVALAAVIAAGWLAPPAPWRWMLWAAGAVALAAMVLLRRRLRRLATVLEVSTFSVAECRPDGIKRVLRFGQPLELRSRRWPRRFELRPAGQQESIRLDYDRVGFWRAMELIWGYAGFPTLESAPESDDGAT